MRFTHPSAPELLLAVERQLTDLLDELDDQWRYRIRVAITAVAMVRRELDSEPSVPGDDRRDLAERIRAGDLDDRTDAVLSDLLRTTRERLEIVNPAWLGDVDQRLGGDVVTFILTGEQEELRATVRRFLGQQSSEPEVRRVMETVAGYDPAVWAQMAEQLGLQALAVPEEFGGFGADRVTEMIVFEEMGRALLCAPYFATIALAANALRECAGKDAQRAYLPGIADGTRVATVAISPDAGSGDPGAGSVRAEPSGEQWSLHGHADYVVDGQTAGLVLVPAMTSDGLGLFAVEPPAAGLRADPIDALDQTRKLARLTFDGVRVRRTDASGRTEAGLRRTLDLAAVALAAEQVGAARFCLETSVDYARSRVQFGRAIGSFQAIKHRCADMFVSVEAATAVVHYAAWAAEFDEADLPTAASLAKAYCSDVFREVASQTIQIHGGIGFTWEHRAHLYLKRAVASSALLGSPVEHRQRLSQLVT